jgi:1-aminocyclopropane-1-carboxylate deaminase/D-cysteine desulfhydrase-like pyridoxal-dependent ACC family enzyme
VSPKVTRFGAGKKVVRLSSVPTPVEPLPALSTRTSSLFLKRDDRLNDLYGGNKVRKLEHLFGAARAEGKRRLLTVGAAGSHQVLATALLGAREGFEVEAVLVTQPDTAHARRNLRVALARGLRAHPAGAWALAPLVLARWWSRDAYFIPLGGSNATGSLGFVEAARELGAQVRGGAMPEPDVIVVALGSGGTAAGLAVGLEEEGLGTRVVGVAISHPSPALSLASRRLAITTASLAGHSIAFGVRAARRIEVTGRFVGRGYGYPTRAGQEALAEAARAGVMLDPTYTAKAFACALARVQSGRDRTILFWHTLSTAPLEALDDGPDDLPPDVERLLTGARPRP